jgi:hypothetical protein
LMKMRADWASRQEFAREQERVVEQLREARRELARMNDENVRLKRAAGEQ